MSHGISVIGSLAVLVGTGLLAGCGTHDKAPAPASGASAQASSASTPAAPAHYDISRIGAAKAALPAGFDATDVPADTVSEDQLDAPGVGGLSTAAPSVVDPAPCAVLLKPLGATGVGARAQGLIADQGPHMLVVMAAQSDHPAAEITRAGCEHITVTSPDGVSATVEQVPGPDIAGVETAGLQAHVSAGGKTTDEVTYTAALGDRTIVVVQGDVDPPVAADVLGKAVAALRG